MLAERGEVIDNDKGTFLVLQNGIVQRHEADQRDPAMVIFDRYAFDLSQFAGGPPAIKYSIRERYLWQLLFPDPKDPIYIEQPGQFRAELHDRLMAPLYPIAFVVIAFAYLGAPRTNRQSRAMSLLGAIGGGGAAAADRLCLHRVRRQLARGCCRCNTSRSRSPSGSGCYRHPPRPDPRAARLHRQRLRRAQPSASAAASPALVTLTHDESSRGTLSRYFGLRFLGAVAMVFLGIFVLVALLDYIELMRRAARHPECLGAAGRQDLVLSRAAGDRAYPAVLRADRRDVQLPQFVAAATNWWSRAPPACRPGSSFHRR